MINIINPKTTTIEERKWAEASILELNMLFSSGVLVWSAYKTAIVHPCEGLIPCNNPKNTIPDNRGDISSKYCTY